jgi:serralysin
MRFDTEGDEFGADVDGEGFGLEYMPPLGGENTWYANGATPGQGATTPGIFGTTPTDQSYEYVAVTQAPVSGGDVVTLMSGVKWSGVDSTTGKTILSYSFAAPGSVYSYAGFRETLSAFSEADKQLTREMLATLEEVCNITFVEVADNDTECGVLRYAYSDKPGDSLPTPYSGWGFLPATQTPGGDVWLDTDQAESNWDFFRPKLLLHETLHAIGLKHPFASGAVLPAERNIIPYTVMSYSPVAGAQKGYLASYPDGPMVLDIAAVQLLYGAAATNAGDTTYDLAEARFQGFEAVWDAGGTDLFDGSGIAGHAVTLDLNPGAWSNIGVAILGTGYSEETTVDPVTGDTVKTVTNYEHTYDSTLSIAFGAVIENATGTSLGDTLIGNAAGNVLTGLAGNDTLDGRAGSDTLVGGAGDDSYVVNVAADVVDESVLGSGGVDTVNVAFTAAGTYVLPTNIETAVVTSTVTGVNVTGNALNNTLTGNALDNLLSGEAGNDTLFGGGGNDVIDSGDGTDLVRVMGAYADYAITRPDPSTVVLDHVSSTERLTLRNVEFVQFADGTRVLSTSVGTAGNDVLEGTADVDWIDGRAGNDVMTGLGGNDTLYGGEGDDALYGGSGDDFLDGYLGDDRYYYNVGDGADRILDLSGNDRIIFGSGITSSALNVTRVDGLVTMSGGAGQSIAFDYIGSGLYRVDFFEFTDGSPDGNPVVLGASWLNTMFNSAPTGSVTIDGTTEQGRVLTANTSTLADANGLGTFTYKWIRGEQPISNANGATYTLTQQDVGKAISVRVEYNDGERTLETLYSAKTALVTNTNDAATGVLGINNAPVPGAKLNADTGDIEDLDGLGTFSYQWLRGGTPISGATNKSYTLTSSDEQKSISVRVSYKDGSGFNESHLTSPVLQSSSVLVGKTINGSNGNDSLIGTAGADKITANDGNDFITAGAGDDDIRGGNGIDTLALSGARAGYSINIYDSTTLNGRVKAGAGLTDGRDDIQGVERLKFTDIALALDLAGNAATVVKVVGAIYGAGFVQDEAIIGSFLDSVDAGMTEKQLVEQAAASAKFVQLAGGSSNAAFVHYVLVQLADQAASQNEAYYVGELNAGRMTKGDLGVLAAEHANTAAHIDLAGLIETGVEYVY